MAEAVTLGGRQQAELGARGEVLSAEWRLVEAAWRVVEERQEMPQLDQSLATMEESPLQPASSVEVVEVAGQLEWQELRFLSPTLSLPFPLRWRFVNANFPLSYN